VLLVFRASVTKNVIVMAAKDGLKKVSTGVCKVGFEQIISVVRFCIEIRDCVWNVQYSSRVKKKDHLMSPKFLF
jgi:hypothetical protein